MISKEVLDGIKRIIQCVYCIEVFQLMECIDDFEKHLSYMLLYFIPYLIIKILSNYIYLLNILINSVIGIFMEKKSVERGRYTWEILIND